MTSRQTRVGYILCGLLALILRAVLEAPFSSLRGSAWAFSIAFAVPVALAVILVVRQADPPASFRPDPRGSRFVVPSDPGNYSMLVAACFFFGQNFLHTGPGSLAVRILLALGLVALFVFLTTLDYTYLYLNQQGVVVRKLFSKRLIRWYDLASEGVSLTTVDDGTYLVPLRVKVSELGIDQKFLASAIRYYAENPLSRRNIGTAEELARLQDVIAQGYGASRESADAD